VSAPEPLVPVDVSDRIPCATEDILDFVAEKARLAGRSAVHECERNGRFLFIIDGLGEQRELAKTAECVNRLVQDFSRSRFLITCRTGEFAPSLFDRFQRWNIMELDSPTQDEFLSQQPEELQQRARRAFDGSPSLREICARQFLFILLLQLLADDKTKPPVLTRAGLYGSFLDRFLRRWEKKRRGDRVLILQTLEEVAVAMRKRGQTRTRLATRPIRTVIREILRRVDSSPPDEDVQETFDDLLFLGLLERRRDGLGFFQETFQEFLCAKWLDEQPARPEDFSDRDGKRWFRGDFQVDAEVWSFYLELKAAKKRRKT
jgi:predicted NACHT family NTPase